MAHTGLAASSLTLRPSSCRGYTAGGCHPGTGPAPHRGTGPFPSFEPRSDPLSRSQRIHPLITSCEPPHGCRTRNGRERIGPTTQGKDFSDFVVAGTHAPPYPVLARPVLAVSESSAVAQLIQVCWNDEPAVGGSRSESAYPGLESEAFNVPGGLGHESPVQAPIQMADVKLRSQVSCRLASWRVRCCVSRIACFSVVRPASTSRASA